MRKHGNIIGFYHGNIPVVILGEYYMILEACKSGSLAGRPIFPYIEDARPTFGLMDVKKNGRMTGPVLSRGPNWKELRRFLIRNLKDCGFGKSAMEDAIQEEAEKLCNHLTKKTGT